MTSNNPPSLVDICNLAKDRNVKINIAYNDHILWPECYTVTVCRTRGVNSYQTVYRFTQSALDLFGGTEVMARINMIIDELEECMGDEDEYTSD